MKSNTMTTRQAAEELGVSLTTIQKMVDRKELEAWLTIGGHRRVSRDAVMSLLKKKIENPLSAFQAGSGSTVRILLAEDDPIQIAFFESILAQFQHPYELIVANDASTALIQLERCRPDVLVTDLIMKPFDGFHLIDVIHKDLTYRNLAVLVCTSMTREEADECGQLPKWLPLYQKPLKADRILGYLDSILSGRLRQSAESR